MCNCIERVDEMLKEKNACLVATLSLGNHPSRVGLMIEKYDPKKRGRLPSMVATFCPFCGAKYQAVEQSVQLTDGGHTESDNESTPATIGN